MASRWRNYAAPIIARVLQETAGRTEPEIRKALHDAYPFGERKMHPYRIWCSEVRLQRGLTSSKNIVAEVGQEALWTEEAEHE